MAVYGQDKVLRNLSNLSKQKVHDVYQASAGVQAKVVNEARGAVPVFTTNLLKSILPGVVEITNTEVKAEVRAEADYASGVEYGQKPHWPPIDDLRPWAAQKLGDPNLAFVVARSISKKGTRPQPFLGPALLANMKTFANAIKRAMKV